MHIELQSEEQQALVELVESRLGDIGSETRRSQNYTYKDRLKHEHETLRHVLAKLRESLDEVAT